MPIWIDDEIRTSMNRLPQRLSDEFDDVEPRSVRTDVEEIAEALLDEARFPDFVSLLTYRFTREHLLDEGHEPARVT